MAAKKTTTKKQGKGKAYAPVPKGYKANWNVPAGTPWKKNSPYNPANQVVSPVRNSPEKIAAAKKAAAKKAAGKKEPAKKVTTTKAPAKKVVAAKKPNYKNPVVGKDGLTDYQRAISYPKSAGGKKAKLQPYDAKWKANVAKNSKRTGVDKVAEGILKYSPLAGIGYGFEAITGKSLDGPLNKPAKKVNRLGSAANAASYVVGAGAVGKVAKKAIKTLRATKGAKETVAKTGGSTKSKGEAGYNAYVDNLVKKEIARMQREAAKGKK